MIIEIGKYQWAESLQLNPETTIDKSYSGKDTYNMCFDVQKLNSLAILAWFFVDLI
jgi:hypothetical protein